MKFKEFLITEVTQVGYKEIQDKHLFGPVYHGTTPESLESILKNGFKVDHTARNGYLLEPYSPLRGIRIPPPMHHLGFGVYFTRVKSIGKMFNGNTTRGLKEFYINAPRMTTINFGAPNTMMKWWQQNGYDMKSLPDLKSAGLSDQQMYQMWQKATQNLTDNLKSKYDAVWFKGKSIKRLLDGDQVCVYDPKNIFMFNSSLNAEDEYMPGDRVKIRELPIAVYLKNRRQIGRDKENPWDILFGTSSDYYYEVSISPTDRNKIREYYNDKLYNVVMANLQDFLKLRERNSGIPAAENAKQYVDYLTGNSLILNFPESLIEKKLSKGQRIT